MGCSVRDDVEYAMEMFDSIERVVERVKSEGSTYERAFEDTMNIAIERRNFWGLNVETSLYDSSNIMATFNIIWGE
jgi:hypothetical protein